MRSANQDECVDIGQRAVANAGFHAHVSRDRQSIFGWRGEEALTVRCIGAQRVAAIFAWVNGQSDDSAALVEAVAQAYRGGPAPAAATSPAAADPGGGGNGRHPGGGAGGAAARPDFRAAAW